MSATSAIGPGFLTQTCVFTAQLGASFAFVILLSILLDLGAQLNIWQIITATGKRAPELADSVQRGMGHVLTALVVFGGLVFNIGNIAGCGLGLEAMTGLPVVWGSVFSAMVAAAIWANKEAGRSMDYFSRALGVLMILLTAYIAFTAHPPMAPVIRGAVWPEKIDFHAVLTLVGGTVGGYITFAGAHRLLDAGIKDHKQARRSALQGILIASVMRILLFLAAWGIVAGGAQIDAQNPPASVFRLAAGDVGLRFFGLVMWAAAITSVVGATFTSLSFLGTSLPVFQRAKHWPAWGFIGLSLGIFVGIGKPVTLLVWAGTLNGFVLPIGLSLMLIAARRNGVFKQFHLSIWLEIAGWAVAVIMGAMAVWVVM
jgi:Mn2+/Fe2+ NRAMP family transporter